MVDSPIYGGQRPRQGSTGITAEQAREILRARKEAYDGLLGFARYVDIPGVPLTESDDDFAVVETPLAAHHVLTYEVLDDMVKGKLAYDPETMERCSPMDGKVCRRVLIMEPPGSAKSTCASVVFPTYVMGRWPGTEIILTGYGDVITKRHGKRARQLVKSPSYGAVFDTGLDPGMKAADDWTLKNGSSYKAAGILSGITGFRADGLIWDDLIKGRKEADSETIRNDTWNAYLDDARSRKKPNAWEVGIGCLTGETPIATPTGQTPIRDIKIGDEVLSWTPNGPVTTTVTNWINHGDDTIYAIHTSCGKVVRGNERHPFFVEREGKLRWVRLRDLTTADKMLLQNGVPTGEKPASRKGATNPRNASNGARNAIANGVGRLVAKSAGVLLRIVKRITSTATASLVPTSNAWNLSVAGSATSAGNRPRSSMPPTTSIDSALTIATTAKWSGGCSVTNATSGWDTSIRPTFSKKRLRTSDCTTTGIERIERDGVENVYDIEVTPCENFIASGIVTHNTRWHEDDPIGRILPEGYSGENGFMRGRDGNIWFVICLPAKAERTDDPLGREIGEYLWPEWFGEDYWADKKINPRSWASLYQQRPAPDDGLYFRKEYFRRYKTIPEGNKYISFDPAVTESEDADETAIHVWCVDDYGRIFLLDEWVAHATMDKWIAKLMELIGIHRPREVISESGVIRRAAEPFIRRAMMNTKNFAVFEYVSRHADKQAMARAAQGMYAAGMIYHPDTSVGDNMEDELLRFPTAKKDHRVDSVANLCLRLEAIFAANPVREVQEESRILGGSELKVRDLMPPRFPTKGKSRWHNKKFK